MGSVKNEREDAQRRIDRFNARLNQIGGDPISNRPCCSALTVVLLIHLALHAIMLILAIDADNLGWTVFWLFSLCLDLNALSETRW